MSKMTLLAVAALLALSPGASRASPPKKFALAVMHFNIQYVAGGLVGFLQGPDPRIDKSAEEIEDQIIVESFEPVLDLYAAHPSWGCNLEMQGYMLDVIGARHPGVLTKLKSLATSGQVEVVSFHYSAQLFLANAVEDWSRSADLTRATFAKWGVPLGQAVFCQEGQAGIGMAAAMKDKGYKTLVWPKNLYSYQYGEGLPAPLYQFGDVNMITSRAFVDAKSGIDTQWSYLDDGELLATGGLDPYFPILFHKDPTALAAYEAKVAALEGQGYLVTTVSKYAEAVLAQLTPPPAPLLLDGTWQPNSTNGIHKWLGGNGIWADVERDNDVHTLQWLAHRELVAAQTIAAQAHLDAQATLDSGFRLLALSEVSDASGINPFRGEVEYGIAHATEALRLARGVIVDAKAALGMASAMVKIDTQAGAVLPPGEPANPTPVDAPPVAITADGGDRQPKLEWSHLGDGHDRVAITFPVGTSNTLSVHFPGTAGDIIYTPGLTHAPMHVPRAGFVFSKYQLALSDGLIGLGGGLYAIKDLGRVHVSAAISQGPDVDFADETAAPDEEVTWVFHVVRGSDAQAAAVATGLNVLPTVWR